MKQLFSFCTIYFFSIFLGAQPEYWDTFSEEIYMEIKVNPNGDIFFSDSYSSPLLKVNTKDKTVDKQTSGGNDLMASNIVFFTPENWIVLDKLETSLYTLDAGKTWYQFLFPKNISQYFIASQTSKTIWFFSETRELYYTSNFGRLWKKHPDFKFKDAEDYALHVRFDEHNKKGLLFTGKTYKLYIIKTGEGKLYEEIPLPSTSTDQPILQLEMGRHYFLINTDQEVYYTPQSKIKWKKLPGAVSFRKSKTDQILTKNENGSFSLYNEFGEKIWHYQEPWQDSAFVISFDFLNDTLYLHTHNSLYKITPSYVQKLNLLKKGVDIFVPSDNIIKINDSSFLGYKENCLYLKTQELYKWKRVKEFPFIINHMAFFQDKLIIKTEEKSFEVDKKDYSLKPTKISPSSIEHWTLKKVFVEQFSTISCRTSYELSHLAQPESFFESSEKKTIINKIIELIKNYKQGVDSSIFISFSEEELEKFWNLLKENNHEIIKYRIDYYSLDQEKIKHRIKNISLYDILSIFTKKKSQNIYLQKENTTGFLVLQLENNIQISLKSNNYPWKQSTNYLQFPWQLQINGFAFPIISKDLASLVNELFEGEFFDLVYSDKYLLFLNCIDYFLSEEKE